VAKMGLYSTFGTDAKSENAGVWIDVDKTETGETIRFLIARQSRTNQKYAATLARVIGPYRQQLANEMVSEALSNKLNIQVFCESVLLGWENVTDRNGKPLEFNVSNAINLMTELHDLYQLLNAKSQSLVTFKDKSLELVVKN
jgi:hypothetical protein